VIITQEGAMYSNDAHVDLQTLRIALQRALQLRPELRIAIQADKSAQQGQVVKVMDPAKLLVLNV
jgi:biopolymer transport protein ExbD